MKSPRPWSLQLRLRLPIDRPVILESVTRNEIVQLLAQLLASAVLTETSALEGSDETH